MVPLVEFPGTFGLSEHYLDILIWLALSWDRMLSVYPIFFHMVYCFDEQISMVRRPFLQCPLSYGCFSHGYVAYEVDHGPI